MRSFGLGFLKLSLAAMVASMVTVGVAQQSAHVHKVSQQAAPATSDAPVIHEAGVPSFHARLPKGPLPATLPPAMFSDPRVQAAYAMAAKVRPALYQQPCYCNCDKEVGHHSLLDCFAGDHASICQTCMMEGVFAYRETKAGKTPAQIRAEIERGQWKSVNLNDLLLAKQVY